MDSNGDLYITNFCWSSEGCARIYKYTADGVPLGFIPLSSPVMDVAIDGMDNLYAVDYHNRDLLIWSPDGTLASRMSLEEAPFPNYLAVNSESRLFVADGDWIALVNTSDGTVLGEWEVDLDTDIAVFPEENMVYWGGYCGRQTLCGMSSSVIPYQVGADDPACWLHGGALFSDSRGKLVYVSAHGDKMCVLNSDGTLHYETELEERGPSRVGDVVVDEQNRAFVVSPGRVRIYQLNYP
jgi:hypothetical protein